MSKATSPSGEYSVKKKPTIGTEDQIAPVLKPAEVDKSTRFLFEDIGPTNQPKVARRDGIKQSGPALDDKAPVFTPEQFSNVKSGGCPNGCCDSIPCCDVHETHCPRFGIFADFLYLHPRDADIAYALPQNGLVVGAAPNGPIATVDPQYEPGIRGGLSYYVDEHTRISSAYTFFESSAVSEVNNANFINPLLLFPNALNVGFAAQPVTAAYDIDFQLIDVQFEGAIKNTEKYWWGYLVGARYGALDQQLQVAYDFALPDGVRILDTTINFDGAGPRIGLQGERQIFPCRKWTVFGRGVANFLAGEFRSTYRQFNETFTLVEAETAFSEDKIVSLLELEVGVAWHSEEGHVRIWGGYMINAWLNTITTSDWIQGVQNENYQDLGDTMTFDGLMAGLELRL